MKIAKNDRYLLDKISNIFKLDVRYFATNFTWISLVEILATIINFLLALTFARYLSKDTFGHFTYVQSLFYVVSFFGLTGMGTSVSRAVAKGKFESVFDGTVVTFLTALGGVIVLDILVFFFLDPTLRLPTFLISLYFPFFHSSTYYISFLQGQQRFKEAAVFTGITRIVPSMLLITALVLGFHSLETLLTITFLTPTLLSIIFSVSYLKQYFLHWKPDIWNSITLYGLKLSAVDVLPAIALHIDKVIIGTLLPPHHLAIYTYALVIPDIIKGYLKNISSLALPKLTTLKYSDYKQVVGKHAGILFFLSLIIVLIYIISIRLFFSLFFPTYIDSVPLSQIYIVSLLTIPSLLFTTWFQAHGQSRKLMKMNTVYFTVQLVFTFVLTKYFGLPGAVIARTLTRLLSAIYSGLLFL